MKRKGLIIYVSRTGNTEKVALKFKKAFEEHNWLCDCIKITKNMKPVNLDDYDMVCVGSLVMGGAPAREIGAFWMGGGRLDSAEPGGIPEGGPPPGAPGKIPSPLPGITKWRHDPSKYKKGIAFVTYGGLRRGPAEVLPALSLLELQMDDQGYRCVGKFACPGKDDTPLFSQESGTDNPGANRGWHWDQQSRPNERDLQKAEIFMSEIIEDYFQPTEIPADSQYICIS